MKLISLCLFLLTMILLSGCATYSHETDLAGIISYAEEKKPQTKTICTYSELWYKEKMRAISISCTNMARN